MGDISDRQSFLGYAEFNMTTQGAVPKWSGWASNKVAEPDAAPEPTAPEPAVSETEVETAAEIADEDGKKILARDKTGTPLLSAVDYEEKTVERSLRVPKDSCAIGPRAASKSWPPSAGSEGHFRARGRGHRHLHGAQGENLAYEFCYHFSYMLLPQGGRQQPR